MMAEFHDKSFDAGTKLKLELFRRYVREWIPVFFTDSSKNRPNCRRVNIYDFFAGPGHDTEGNPGSPLIVVEELKQYCEKNHKLKAPGINVHIHFNDKDPSHIEQLRNAIAELTCPEDCCRTTFSALPFQDAFNQHVPDIQLPDSANLVIIDQCGVKEVTPTVLRQLADCSMTDVLFFISSSVIRRFCEQLGITDEFQIDAEAIRAVDYNKVHRRICDFYRTHLQDRQYYLAPFSIKKGSNIYGVIFGSGHPLGLEKFLRVCWQLDGDTGEANYNIDGDLSWGGKSLLFQECNVVRKIDVFEGELCEFIAANRPNNREVYLFTLTHGFLPKHANGILRRLQKERGLTVVDVEKDRPARAASFYLSSKHWRGPPKVTFSLKGDQ